MFRDGYACSQAIVGVYGTPHGLPHDQAMRVAAGFAGGMRLGETCGAVTDAFMVLGIANRRADAAIANAFSFAMIAVRQPGAAATPYGTLDLP